MALAIHFDRLIRAALSDNLSLLTAYLSWRFIWLLGTRYLQRQKDSEAQTATMRKSKSKRKNRGLIRERTVTFYHVSTIVAIVAVFFAVYYPNINKAEEVASAPQFAPSDAWEDGLYWLRDNSPEPLGDPEAYYAVYQRGSQRYQYPETAYGITSWWDYGYWITRTAHRIPTANPAQDPGPITNVATFFLSEDRETAAVLREEMGTRYVVIDYAMALTKFWAIATWAQRSPEEYRDVFYLVENNEATPIQVFLPEYYHSLLVRLFNFDGKAVEDGKPLVITYEERTVDQGNRIKLITAANEYPSYAAAEAFIAAQTEGNYAIVSANPFVSPIPLAAVTDYELVYANDLALNATDLGGNAEVKIFRYTGDTAQE